MSQTSQKPLTVYITKFALTTGIIRQSAFLYDGDPRTITYTNSLGYRELFRKPYWHQTLEQAQAHAEQMRQRKILAVRKQLAKLQKIRVFAVVDHASPEAG